MSKTSILTQAVTINGDGVAINYTPPQSPFVNPNAPEGGPVAVSLIVGTITVPVPAGARWVSPNPLPGSTFVKQVKAASADTGFSFTSNGPPQTMCVQGLSNIYITSTGVEPLDLVWG